MLWKIAKYILIAVVFILLITQEKVCEHIGLGKQELAQDVRLESSATDSIEEVSDAVSQIHAKNLQIQPGDSLWSWDNSRYKYVPDGIYDPEAEAQKPVVHLIPPDATASGVVKLRWPMLDQVRYSPKYVDEVMGNMYVPLFAPAIKELEGRVVELAGYVIPFDESGMSLVLSYNVFASCFFCGKGSPTSVVSVFLEEPQKYNTDDFRAFQGYLRLNYQDPDEFYYILHDAREVAL